MARNEGMTRRGPVDANEFYQNRKRELVNDGSYVWMIHQATGAEAAVLNTPVAIERKLKQGFVEAEVVEEVVKRPVVKAAAAPSAADEPAPAKRGPGRPRKTEDGE